MNVLIGFFNIFIVVLSFGCCEFAKTKNGYRVVSTKKLEHTVVKVGELYISMSIPENMVYNSKSTSNIKVSLDGIEWHPFNRFVNEHEHVKEPIHGIGKCEIHGQGNALAITNKSSSQTHIFTVSGTDIIYRSTIAGTVGLFFTTSDNVTLIGLCDHAGDNELKTTLVVKGGNVTYHTACEWMPRTYDDILEYDGKLVFKSYNVEYACESSDYGVTWKRSSLFGATENANEDDTENATWSMQFIRTAKPSKEQYMCKFGDMVYLFDAENMDSALTSANGELLTLEGYNGNDILEVGDMCVFMGNKISKTHRTFHFFERDNPTKSFTKALMYNDDVDEFHVEGDSIYIVRKITNRNKHSDILKYRYRRDGGFDHSLIHCDFPLRDVLFLDGNMFASDGHGSFGLVAFETHATMR